MTQQRRFTKEFEDEAVRLVWTSGRSQRGIAEDLGIGLPTLVRWISRSRDRQIDEPDSSGQEDVAAELKRLRRENEILRQERDILKRATVGSTGRCNGLCEGSAWCFVAKGFSRSGVEPQGNCVEVVLAVHGQI
jgi:transposase